MRLHKKYFLAIFTAFGIQAVFGINLANAVCESEIDLYCKAYDALHKKRPSDWSKYNSYDQCYKDYMQYPFELGQQSPENVRQEYTFANEDIINKEASWKRIKDDDFMTNPFIRETYARRCVAKAVMDSPGQFKKAGSNQQNNKSSNQPSNSDASSNQSNSAESSSLSNKQSYQAAQLAHNQANAGKGKKRNAQAEVPECVKANADETHFKNVCNYAVNISYCFSGENYSGASSAAKQLLADLRCQNEQFANTELSAGEELAGDYIGLNIAAMVCKSPSQPLDMYFEEPEALGRCSF